MELYHGTKQVISAINLEKCRKRTDFGRGFYLTGKVGTAQNWAVRRASISGIPTIMRYMISDGLHALPGKRITTPDIEWLEFICLNRHNNPPHSESNEPRHGYHWVSGPIADDKVVDVVAEYIKGKITAEEAIKRTKALPQTYQFSLHTQEALSFVDDVYVDYRQLKDGRWSHTWIRRK